MSIYKFVEFQCRYCGAKTTLAINRGEPNPGRCPRKQGDKPHSWITNRKI